MSQPYIDWELTESRSFGKYRYEIIRAVAADGNTTYKGFVVFANGEDQWLQNSSFDALRGSLITLGQQHT
jgi:hypothetical protein